MDLATFTQAIVSGQRRALAKAITLVESTRADHRQQAQLVLNQLLPHTGKSIRIGISGAPGAGKSTFIETLGLMLLEAGHRLAVLAIDPSSSVSGGSILGDKTRMEQLSHQEHAFIRPSPSSGALGGVALMTRETILLCEAAGYDVILVETVGVGQSEITVAGMVDVFVLLQLPNTGDDLQAIKRGIIELADVIVYNKVELDEVAAERACAQMRSALSLLRPSHPDWQVPVLKVSALSAQGVDVFWQSVLQFQSLTQGSGAFAQKRKEQARDWLWSLVRHGLQERFMHHPAVAQQWSQTIREVMQQDVTPLFAAQRLLDLFHHEDPQ